MSRQLSTARGVDKLLQIGVAYISKIFDSEVIALMPENSHLAIRGKSGIKEILDSKEKSIAQWVYDLGQPAGLGTDTLSFSDALYIPLLGSQRAIGVLKIRPRKVEHFMAPDQMRLLNPVHIK